MARQQFECFAEERFGSGDFPPSMSGISRRKFMSAAAGAGAFILSSGLWRPTRARADAPGPGTPNPIPETTTLFGEAFHFLPPAPTLDQSLVTDFNGFVGVINMFGGTGHGSDGTAFTYNVDQRFMNGVFVGTDGRVHDATLGFI